jgi:hypothetical protein
MVSQRNFHLGTPHLEALNLLIAIVLRTNRFLLHYTARDAVDVLEQGTNGVDGMKDAAVSYIAKEGDGRAAKPLFGLVQFKRRKVLIKLVLDGTSRLIQGEYCAVTLHPFCESLFLIWFAAAARAQVHWGAIASRFPAHDSSCEITSPDQLTENVLIASKELHSGNSTAGSGNKVVLGGIEESTEETPPLVPPKDNVPLADKEDSIQAHTPSVAKLSPTPKLEISEPNTDPQETGLRVSSQSTRPSLNDLFGNTLDFSYLDKPKVKLAPRPSVVDRKHHSVRISTETRPTSALPTGLRAARPASSVVRPISRDIIGRLPPPPPIPESPIFLIPRPKSSSGSVKSLPATLPRSQGNSKERQRLMKFREMYKQKEIKAKGKELVLPRAPIPEEHPLVGDAESTTLAVESSIPVEVADDTVTKEHSQTGQSTEEPASTPAPNPVEADPFVPKSVDTEVTTDQNVEAPSSAGELPTEKSEPEMHSSNQSQTKIPDQSGANTVALDTEKPVETSPTIDPIVHEEPTAHDEKSEPLVQHIFIAPKSQTPTIEDTTIPPSQSSPTSVQDSVGPTSTRPTSVSEVSEQVAPDGSGVQSLKTIEVTDSSKTAPVGLDERDQSDLDESPLETSQTTPTPQTPAPAADTPRPIPIEHQKIDSVSLAVPGHSNNEGRNASVSSNASSGNRPRLSIATPSVDPSASPSSMDYDDDLINELSTAEVEEATPISVSKSPLSTFFSRKGSISGFRAFSSPQNGAAITPEKPLRSITNSSSPISRLRSISGGSAPLPPRSTGDNVTVAKKRVEGGIAAKIADLQRSFSRTSPTSGTPTATPPKSVFHRTNTLQPAPTTNNFTPPKRGSSLFPIRKASSPPPLEDPASILETPSPPSREVTYNILQQPRFTTSSPTPERVLETPSVSIQPRSVTVRATIIRTDSTSTPDGAISANGAISPKPTKESVAREAMGLGLGLGPEVLRSGPTIMSNHQRAQSTASHRRIFHPSARSSSVSSLHSTPTPTTPEQRDFLGFRRSIDGWRSFGRRKSLSKSPGPPPTSTWPPHGSVVPASGGAAGLSPLPRSMSNSSLDTSASTESASNEHHHHHNKKSANRASRLLKRMSSSISSMATGNRVQLQTLNEKATSGQEIAKVQTVKPLGIAVGDLNVQFPDTLVGHFQIL